MPTDSQAKSTPLQFRGMLPILPTVLTPEGTLDEASQRRVVQYCLECGAVAIGHFGIASEYHKISERDRRRLSDIIVDEVADRVPVFLGVTAAGVKISLDYARQAEQQGASLIMASLPTSGCPDADTAYAFYESLCSAVTVPIILQETPETSAVFTPELILRMGREIAGLQYVKAEGRHFLEKTAVLKAAPEAGIQLIGGAGGRHLIHMLRLGVTAFMTGTEALDLHAAAVGTFLDGDHAAAAAIYFDRILPYLQFYLDYPEELLKWMLCERGVIACPLPLPPPAARPMGTAERAEFRWVLERIGFHEYRPLHPSDGT